MCPLDIYSYPIIFDSTLVDLSLLVGFFQFQRIRSGEKVNLAHISSLSRWHGKTVDKVTLRNASNDYSIADIANDYYPFGMIMPDRKYSAGSAYRYGFNGQEKSTELFDGTTSAKYWEYDSRIGKRWNLDPKSVFEESPYSTMKNNPMFLSDPMGDTVILSSGFANNPNAMKAFEELKKSPRFQELYGQYDIAGGVSGNKQNGDFSSINLYLDYSSKAINTVDPKKEAGAGLTLVEHYLKSTKSWYSWSEYNSKFKGSEPGAAQYKKNLQGAIAEKSGIRMKVLLRPEMTYSVGGIMATLLHESITHGFYDRVFESGAKEFLNMPFKHISFDYNKTIGQNAVNGAIPGGHIAQGFGLVTDLNIIEQQVLNRTDEIVGKNFIKEMENIKKYYYDKQSIPVYNGYNEVHKPISLQEYLGN